MELNATSNSVLLAYLFSAVCFILALLGLAGPETARRGNIFGIVGMVVAIGTTLLIAESFSWITIGSAILIGGTIGTVIALKIQMTALPQLVAAFHSLVGLAAVFVAAAALGNPDSLGIGSVGNIHTASLIEMTVGCTIGAITFTGSVIAFAKLQGLVSGAPVVFKGQHILNLLLGIGLVVLASYFVATESHTLFWAVTFLAFFIGVMIIIPIGGADMPVVVSMLNSYSGWAAVGIGFTLSNNLLIITGSLVGSSGAILSYIMCKGMNRSFFNVILGGFGAEDGAVAGGGETEERPVKRGSAEDAAFLMKNSGSVIIIPGYGMAVAQAQHALREMVDLLKEGGVKVRYAIHPVAGRMPGHMNVLLAEAKVPYDEVLEMEDINSDFGTTDVAFVIGANDITNPAAKTDKASPIYGMPILDVESAGTILFVKRSLASGYAGVNNELFFRDNTMMLLSDAKKMCEDIVKGLS